MAKASGTDLAGFKSQLATTKMFCDAGRSARVHDQPGPRQDDGPGAQVLLRSRPAGRGREDRRRRRHRASRAARRSATRRTSKMRFDAELHEARRRRQALIASGLRHAPPRQPASRARRRIGCSGALPFILLLFVYVIASHAAAGGERRTTSCCRRRPRSRTRCSSTRSRKTGAAARCCSGSTPGASLERHRSSRWRISAAIGTGVRRRASA